MNPVVTLTEAAKHLRCSKAHLCNVVNGKVARLPPLPTVRIGRRVLIRRDTLQQWLWLVERGHAKIPADLNSSLETHGKD